MTMSEGALDLSLSSYALTTKHAARPLETVSSDSGRASSDSTSSEMHEDIKPDLKPSPQGYNIPPAFSTGHHHLKSSHPSPGPIAFPGSHLRDLPHLSHMLINPTGSPPLTINPGNMDNFSNQASPVHVTSGTGDDVLKPSVPTERATEARNAMRPYKMFPVDPFGMYGNPLMAGASGTLSPSPVAMQSLYDSMSPSGFPTFPLTPLTSHLLQRKRRAENRENATSNNNATASSMPSTTQQNNTNSNSSNQNNSNNNCGDGSSRVSTSSPGSPRDDFDSNCGSDGEKRKRNTSSADVKKDDAYWDRRRKNNEAAKRSRDARRQKEEEIAMRAAFLEQENLKLRAQVAILKNETAKLHYMLYNRM